MRVPYYYFRQVINLLGADFFWRDPYKNEVDAVLMNKKPIPVEIKHGKIDFGGLTAFMEKFKVSKGYIISSDREERRRTGKKLILVIPAFKFFLK